MVPSWNGDRDLAGPQGHAVDDTRAAAPAPTQPGS